MNRKPVSDHLKLDREHGSHPHDSHPQASDAADLASTDMSAEPSSRVADSEQHAAFAPGAGVPAEPASEAIRRLETELAATQDRYLRLAAEYDNFRKRTARERAELNDRAQAALVVRLLDIMDDMDRLTTESTASPETLREAALLVDRKLRKELEAAGLERIDPAGSAFDPSLHEAVATLPPPTPDQDHIVHATYQTGYRFKGALVRPARVQVYSSQGQG